MTSTTVAHLLNEGARLLHSQRPDEALDPLRRAQALAPDDPDVAINLGGALIMTSKWRQAVRVLEAAVARHPDNSRLWLNLAAAYLGRLETASLAAQDRAIAAYQRALALDHSAHSAHYNIALIYAERGDLNLAQTWFTAALQANPNDRDAALWLRRLEGARREVAGGRSQVAGGGWRVAGRKW